MSNYFLNLAKKISKRLFSTLRLNLRPIKNYRNYFLFRRQRKEWIRKGGTITNNYMILRDYDDYAGNAKGHYFHQDLLVARMIHNATPKRHLDVGSRIDGFVAHVASFREIEVVDIRPLRQSDHKNIKFIQADLMYPQKIKKTDSLSCLHAIEHFGLGRYSDSIDIDGHVKGINNLVALVEEKGHFYISFPIGMKDEVHFNAHRVFHPESIFKISSIQNFMELKRFDYVDDNGDLNMDVSPEEVSRNLTYGCGIYTFKKK